MAKEDVKKLKAKKQNYPSYIEQLLKDQEEHNKLLENKEEEKSDDSLLEHSFLYKDFLDDVHFKSVLRDDLSLLGKDGMDLKVTTQFSKLVKPSESGSEPYSGGIPNSKSSVAISRNSRNTNFKTAGQSIMSPRSALDKQVNNFMSK